MSVSLAESSLNSPRGICVRALCRMPRLPALCWAGYLEKTVRQELMPATFSGPALRQTRADTVQNQVQR